MSAPVVVGVTTYLERAVMGVWDVPAVFLPTSYVLPLTRAGATYVALPPQPVTPSQADVVIATLDGLYVAGGYDVDPALYGQAPHAETDAARADRDAWELALIAAARRANLPMLGVCRGAQALNVSRGGTLHQHVPDVVGHTGHQGAHGVFAAMPVSVEPGTALAGLHDAERDVPVYHHQAIDRLGESLVVTARSADGIIEAIEDPTLAFCVATQWHPEQDPGAQRLFDGFVAAARAYRQRADAARAATTTASSSSAS